MDIATVQKQKFLNNIYRIMYSDGTKPSEQEVRKAFTSYATNNPLGLPISVDYNRLQISNMTDVDLLNELMVSSVFNLEILYDSIFENNQQLFSIVTALNNKLNGLRARRKKLEAKVDQLLFANSNSDGYFYSFFETFSGLDKLDMSLTTAYVDLVNNNVTLPKITNAVSDSIINNKIVPSGATYSAVMNDVTLVSDSAIENFDFVLDGLNDTYWNYEFKSDDLGIASVSITIPLDGSYIISKIDGTLLTSSPCSVYMRATPVATGGEDQVRVRDSKDDYTKFSFSIPADYYSSIALTLVKVEPDRLESSTSGLYVYSFGLRDLFISSAYYDSRAILVSAPISIPSSDNKNLAISAVSVEVDSEILPGTNIQYYIAPNIDSASEVGSFNWFRIEPSELGSTQNVVQLSSSNIRSKYIDSTDSDLIFIPEVSTSSGSVNNNDLNPTTLPFTNKTIFRLCSIDPSEKFIEPYILAGLGSLRHYSILLASSRLDTQMYRSLDKWREMINNNNGEVYMDFIANQTTSISPGVFSASAGLLESKVMCSTDQSATHTVTKSRSDFNLAIYLNGAMIGDLPSGTESRSIEWNFVRGINTITVSYDKNFSGLASFNLMTGKTLDEYGTVFLDYFNYLDPIEFRNSPTIEGNTFTIDKLNGNTEILSFKKIANRSMLKYYSNVSDLITAVRYRADLVRFDNPLQSPTIDAVRLKFKHNDNDF